MRGRGLLGIDASHLVFRSVPGRCTDRSPPPGRMETIGAAERIRTMLGIAAEAVAPTGIRPVRHPKRSESLDVSDGTVALTMTTDDELDLFLEFGQSEGLRANAPVKWDNPGIRHFRSAVALFAAAADGIADQSRANEAYRMIVRKAASMIAAGARSATIAAPMPWCCADAMGLIPALDVAVESRDRVANITITEMSVTLRRDELDPIELMRLLAE